MKALFDGCFLNHLDLARLRLIKLRLIQLKRFLFSSLALQLTLFEVLSEYTHIGEHHRLLTGHVRPSVHVVSHDLAGIEAETFLARLVIKKVG